MWVNICRFLKEVKFLKLDLFTAVSTKQYFYCLNHFSMMHFTLQQIVNHKSQVTNHK